MMATKHKGTPTEILAMDTYIKLTRAVNAFENRIFHAGVLDNLTVSQFGVLETLYHLGSLCQGTLSEKLLKSTGNMTLVLDNLEKAGLVRRERSLEDRRQVMIHITEKGREVLSQVYPKVVSAITREVSVLTPDEQRQIGDLCRTLGKNARN
jgi:MarR family 2-MHQ and catechol resistance regulon transcriptional repressor